jgi:uncharacterized protein (DUF2062 family)
MGWRRAGTYFLHRIRRLPGSPHTIAAGFACGAAVSFTPFIGLHFVLAALLAWIIGANVIASAFGTAVGNPWTFPIIWVGIYRLGIMILGWEDGAGLSESVSMAYIFDHPVAVLLPMTVGGVATGAVAWLASYWGALAIVAEYRQLKRARAARRAAANPDRKEQGS